MRFSVYVNECIVLFFAFDLVPVKVSLMERKPRRGLNHFISYYI